MPAAAVTHRAMVRTVNSRTRRRSRSRTFRVISRASGAVASRTESSPRRALRNSFSVISSGPFDEAAQAALGVVEAGPHRADVATDDSCDLLVRQALDEPEHQDLPVLRREHVQRLVDPPGVLR